MWYYDIQSSTNYSHDLGIIETPISPAQHVHSRKYPPSPNQIKKNYDF